VSPAFDFGLPGDAYDTPATLRRALGDRLALGTRWYFYWRFTRTVLRSRAVAVRGLYDDAAWARSSLESMRNLEVCGGRFHVRGMNFIDPAVAPVVFVSNHMSILETFVFPGLIRPRVPVTFVVKDSLVRHPAFGPIMRSREPVVVGRESPREDLQTVLREGVVRLEAGISMVIFPQSSRTRMFDPAEFNTLGVKLARRAGVKVIPVAVKTDMWGNGRVVKDVGPLRRSLPAHIEFGPAMTVEGNGNVQHAAIVSFITERLQRWGGIVRTPAAG
jgi:1-acyl-sn-glycerol-3-phosphate acyltransferase